MAPTWLYTLASFAAAITLGSCQSLSCYDCDPRNFGDECTNPVERNVRVAVCNPAVDNFSSVCISAFLNFTGERVNETGIYRGCKTLRPDVGDYCDYFEQETNAPNVTVVSCIACNSARCNTNKFKDDGTSSAQSASTAIFVLALNFIFVLLLTAFE